jgi:hypothetical protein
MASIVHQQPDPSGQVTTTADTGVITTAAGNMMLVAAFIRALSGAANGSDQPVVDSKANDMLAPILNYAGGLGRLKVYLYPVVTGGSNHSWSYDAGGGNTAEVTIIAREYAPGLALVASSAVGSSDNNGPERTITTGVAGLIGDIAVLLSVSGSGLGGGFVPNNITERNSGQQSTNTHSLSMFLGDTTLASAGAFQASINQNGSDDDMGIFLLRAAGGGGGASPAIGWF